LADEPSGNTLQPTALVHEAYLRLVGSPGGDQGNHRGHFLAAAAEAMRRILVDRARHKRSQKGGGQLAHHDVEEADLAAPEVSDDMLDVDEALNGLASALAFISTTMWAWT
jgi:RNA polymerase sigma factor (TIGR02999 family)